MRRAFGDDSRCHTFYSVGRNEQNLLLPARWLLFSFEMRNTMFHRIRTVCAVPSESERLQPGLRCIPVCLSHGKFTSPGLYFPLRLRAVRSAFPAGVR